jgi:manganese transport protein
VPLGGGDPSPEADRVRGILATAVAASVSTALAEILGGAIALNMLFRTPIRVGAVLTCLVVGFLLFSNTYRRLERIIIGFVSLIGLSFIYELTLVPIDWGRAVVGWVRPEIPEGSMLIVMSVLGAVVMPHNLFLHSRSSRAASGTGRTKRSFVANSITNITIRFSR